MHHMCECAVGLDDGCWLDPSRTVWCWVVGGKCGMLVGLSCELGHVGETVGGGRWALVNLL